MTYSNGSFEEMRECRSPRWYEAVKLSNMQESRNV